MGACSICRGLRIVEGTRADYESLACYHYRERRLGPYSSIYAMRFGDETVGVIVYGMPTAGVELRRAAVGDVFDGFGRGTRLRVLNMNVRCIHRVIIEPRFRGIGLASRLVRETLPKAGVAIVEALAVMGAVNPFFEKAGMKRCEGRASARCVRMTEALGAVGIVEADFIDAEKVQSEIEGLVEPERAFLEREFGLFLGSYGNRRFMESGLERTRYVVGRLSYRPIYYVWFNPEKEIEL